MSYSSEFNDPEAEAMYQKPCAGLSGSACSDNLNCYWDNKTRRCKRDATSVGPDEFQSMMDATVLRLGIKPVTDAANAGGRRRRKCKSRKLKCKRSRRNSRRRY
jgi:hypothetical protein